MPAAMNSWGMPVDHHFGWPALVDRIVRGAASSETSCGCTGRSWRRSSCTAGTTRCAACSCRRCGGCAGGSAAAGLRNVAAGAISDQLRLNADGKPPTSRRQGRSARASGSVPLRMRATSSPEQSCVRHASADLGRAVAPDRVGALRPRRGSTCSMSPARAARRSRSTRARAPSRGRGSGRPARGRCPRGGRRSSRGGAPPGAPRCRRGCSRAGRPR